MFIVHTLCRLRNQTGITADFCIFIGETLDFTCATDDAEQLPLLITAVDGTESLGSANVTDAAEEDGGSYACRLSTDTGPCGGATQNLIVQVFGKQLQNAMEHL